MTHAESWFYEKVVNGKRKKEELREIVARIPSDIVPDIDAQKFTLRNEYKISLTPVFV